MSRKKQPRGEYDQPLALNMDPDEALARFAQTDPKEMAAVELLVRDDATIDGLMRAFEAAAYGTEDGEGFWSARDLMQLFEYTEWRNFRAVLAKAWTACEQAGQDTAAHFAVPDLSSPWRPDEVFVEANKNPQGGRPSEDVFLSRYGAYLVAENADPSKTPVAFAQTYFATQARRQELADQAVEPEPSYDQKRVELRTRLKTHHKLLAGAASNAGVKTKEQFENFMGAGLRGMYGMNKAKLLQKKGLPRGANHIDFAGHEELAAYYFKATQAEAKLRREGNTGPRRANAIHKEAGEAVRTAIEELGGVMPEDLPTEEDVTIVERRLKADAKAKAKSIAPPKAKKKG